MATIQFDLGGGASLALPSHVVAQRLIAGLQDQHRQPPEPRHKIGEYLTGQGGIYAGDILGDDGTLYGLLVSQEEDVGRAKWGSSGARDLSEWDGLSNTSSLRNESPAAKLASDYEREGHCDFYLPARRELMVAMANIPHLFGKEGWYWTSTPRAEEFAWAVVFEDGYVYAYFRYYEFRVRPVRRFTA